MGEKGDKRKDEWVGERMIEREAERMDDREYEGKSE